MNSFLFFNFSWRAFPVFLIVSTNSEVTEQNRISFGRFCGDFWMIFSILLNSLQNAGFLFTETADFLEKCAYSKLVSRRKLGQFYFERKK